MKKDRTLTIPTLITESLLSTVKQMGSAKITQHADYSITITKKNIPSSYTKFENEEGFTENLFTCLGKYKSFYLTKEMNEDRGKEFYALYTPKPKPDKNIYFEGWTHQFIPQFQIEGKEIVGRKAAALELFGSDGPGELSYIESIIKEESLDNYSINDVRIIGEKKNTKIKGKKYYIYRIGNNPERIYGLNNLHKRLPGTKLSDLRKCNFPKAKTLHEQLIDEYIIRKDPDNPKGFIIEGEANEGNISIPNRTKLKDYITKYGSSCSQPTLLKIIEFLEQ